MRFLTYLFILSTSVHLWAKPLKIEGSGITSNQKQAYLYSYTGDELFIKDSAQITKGVFQFKVDLENTPSGIYALGLSETDLINIVIKSEEGISVSKQNNKWTIVEGNDSKEIQQYFNHINDYDQALTKIELQYRAIVHLQQANPEEFQRQFETIRLSLDSLNQARVNFFKSFHQNTSSAFARKVASIFLMDENTSKLTYFKSTDFTDEELTRGLIIEKKINMYFMSFVSINAETIASEFSSVLSLAPKASVARKITYTALIKIAASVNPDYCRELYGAMKSEFKDDEFTTRTKQYIPKGAPQIGEEAPDIALPDANGKIIKLSDLKGQIVLLDFWASWCGPCRGEMPNVVEAYNQYNSKGFTVYSVSLDSDKNRWLSAIQQDGMVWDAHVSELKKWDSDAAREYFVRGIPATFLIDKDGIIIGKNLRGAALHKKLAELLPN